MVPPREARLKICIFVLVMFLCYVENLKKYFSLLFMFYIIKIKKMRQTFLEENVIKVFLKFQMLIQNSK